MLEDMINNLQKIVLEIPASPKPPVLVIGRTGVGKSTLILHMQGVPLESYKNRGRDKARVPSTYQSEVRHPIIGHTIDPGTVVHKLFEIQGQYICDCPGYGDLRGTETDIINNVGLQLLTEISGGVKAIVVVIPVETFERNNIDERLPKLALMLRKIFEDPEVAIKQGSVIFAVNGGSEEDRDVIKKDLEYYRSKYAPKNSDSLTTRFFKKVKNIGSIFPIFGKKEEKKTITTPLQRLLQLKKNQIQLHHLRLKTDHIYVKFLI